MKRKQDSAINRVVVLFEGDYVKTLTWFATQIPALGNVRPLEMMDDERIDRLLSWMDTTDA